VKRSSIGVCGVVLLAFCAGFLTHLLYLRWHPADAEKAATNTITRSQWEPQSHRVSFTPLSSAQAQDSIVELPLLPARDVEKIRALTGQQTRIRGRVFRVGHSAKSNTYFLNFGPSREALTAVIFASAVELFDKNKLPPKKFENREVEISGTIKDHPQYGLEVVLEHPKQIKILD
jgi:hypothetical protein